MSETKPSVQEQQQRVVRIATGVVAVLFFIVCVVLWATDYDQTIALACGLGALASAGAFGMFVLQKRSDDRRKQD